VIEMGKPPDGGRFDTAENEATGESNENCCHCVPSTWVTLTTTDPVPELMVVAHCNVEVDVHAVVEQRRTPTLALGVTSRVPKFKPEMVVVVDPDPTALMGADQVSTGASNE
jgi:hypothetical protein